MAVPLLIGGTVLGAVGGIQQGRAQNRLAQYKAAQLEQKARQERAVSQRKAIDVRRRARTAESRTLALAAASGGGASDPTVMNLMAGIAGEGEFAAQTAVYEGEERARGAEMGAEGARIEGSQAQTAGYVGAASTIMSSAAQGLAMKYSPTPPNVTTGLYSANAFATECLNDLHATI